MYLVYNTCQCNSIGTEYGFETRIRRQSTEGLRDDDAGRPAAPAPPMMAFLCVHWIPIRWKFQANYPSYYEKLRPCLVGEKLVFLVL